MKRIYWIALVIVTVIVSSCSKGDEEVDDKLNGNTFEFERYYIRTDRSTSVYNWSTPCEYLEDYDKDLGIDLSNYFDNAFPEGALPKECYIYNGILDGERINENDEVICDTIFSLKFSGSTSVLDIHSVKCAVTKGQKLKCKFYSFLFKEGRYKIANTAYYASVRKDAIDIVSEFNEVKGTLPLNGYKYIIYGKSDYSKLIDKAIDTSEHFAYKREGGQLYFTNNDKELQGRIDFDKMILKLEQISPIKKDIGEFKLK